MHVGDQEGASSFVTLECYRINFSQAHSIRFNASSVKEGQSSPLGWPSEKKCVVGKLMKWKVLHYAAKSPCHVSTRTAGCDSDSVFMSDACVGKGASDSQYLSPTCGAMHSRCACGLKSTSNTPLVHCQTHFFIMYGHTSASAHGTVTHIQSLQTRHVSSCTCLNVTVRHILIYGRYRVNDGVVVTFTQAGVTSCLVEGEMGKNGLYLVLSLWN